jgi:hypothetical protein
LPRLVVPGMRPAHAASPRRAYSSRGATERHLAPRREVVSMVVRGVPSGGEAPETDRGLGSNCGPHGGGDAWCHAPHEATHG